VTDSYAGQDGAGKGLSDSASPQPDGLRIENRMGLPVRDRVPDRARPLRLWVTVTMDSATRAVTSMEMSCRMQRRRGGADR
jgi:hypothetical protein